jgi:hypothetical protein
MVCVGLPALNVNEAEMDPIKTNVLADGMLSGSMVWAVFQALKSRRRRKGER